jgi:hypothetical protein
VMYYNTQLVAPTTDGRYSALDLLSSVLRSYPIAEIPLVVAPKGITVRTATPGLRCDAPWDPLRMMVLSEQAAQQPSATSRDGSSIRLASVRGSDMRCLALRIDLDAIDGPDHGALLSIEFSPCLRNDNLQQIKKDADGTIRTESASRESITFVYDRVTTTPVTLFVHFFHTSYDGSQVVPGYALLMNPPEAGIQATHTADVAQASERKGGFTVSTITYGSPLFDEYARTILPRFYRPV